MKRLVLAGGGLAHLEVLRRFALAPPVNAAVTLMVPRRRVLYPPALPGLVAGLTEPARCEIDLAALAGRARIDLVEDGVAAIDNTRRVVVTAARREFEYDFASVDVSATPFQPDLRGLREFALLARPAEVLAEGWERVVELAREGGLAKLTVVGGGATGVELVLAMRHRLRLALARERFAACGISIVTAAPRLLDTLPPPLTELVERLCAERGISILRGAAATALERDAVLLANGARLRSDVTIWATGPRPPRWFAACGLALDAAGCLVTDERLRSTSDKRIFAAGDCAVSAAHPGPRSDAHARAQGPVLFANLQRALAGEVPEPWQPPDAAREFLTLGEREACAWRGERVQTTPRWLIWRRKDWQDRAWMGRHRPGR
jgi:selenide,water dikinase